MTNKKAGRAVERRAVVTAARRFYFSIIVILSMAYVVLPTTAQAQSYRFTTVQVEGNQRVDAATILTYAGIAKGQSVSAAGLNDAYQRILNSGLFESVAIEPRGGTLRITVQEYPTINRIAFEGNKRLKDDDLALLVRSQSRHVYSPTVAEADAAIITEALGQAGRFAGTVSPKIIRRSDNRVDLVFEITEGRVVEIERLSFVGNRAYSDRRLRRVLETKQAGILRQIIQRDTFIPDRIEFDKQVLRDFYLSRGYVDFQVHSVNSEISRERDGFFVTFNVREGQSFNIGEVTTTSDLIEVDAEEFQSAVKLRSGSTYTPTKVEATIARLERLAIKKGLNFIRVEPRIIRNDRDLTLDVEFVLTKGPRIFVERIDVEGNSTTLDRVVRRQFRVVEGDPFNPREIRESAERIRALGFFSKADVNAREGSAPDQVVIDVDVEEQNTGSLNFGASYGTDAGFGLNIGFSERNFLGRGQSLSVSFNTASADAAASFSFSEPAFLGRDLRFGLNGFYTTSSNSNSHYNTRVTGFGTSLGFPVSENGRLQLRYNIKRGKIHGVDTTSPATGNDYLGNPNLTFNSPLLVADQNADNTITSSIGYSYSFDSRRSGLNPDAGIVLRFSQDYAGVGGDAKYIKTEVLLGAETRVWNNEVTLRAILEGGAISTLGGYDSQITDRFFLSSSKLRGFEANGVGPRATSSTNDDALGGNAFAVARFEANFPIGLPEEYGLSAGVFYDVGSVWGLDGAHGIDDDFHLRSSVGVSIFWTTAIGPLRFNFTKALKKQPYDLDRSFEMTIQTTF